MMRLSANRPSGCVAGCRPLGRFAAVLALGATLLLAPAEAGAAGNVIKQLDWVVQNDTVMGGRSSARLAWNAQQQLVWTGNLSLENNGGFVSIFARNGWADWSAYQGVEVVIEGAGRAVQVTLQRGDRVVRAGGYRALVATEPSGDTRVTIPFSAFVLKRFGRAIRGPALSGGLSQVGRLGLLIADKREGPFKVVLKSVKPVRMSETQRLSEAARKRLVAAIELGVPTFNGGDVAGCAMIYRTALSGLQREGALSGSWASRLVKGALAKAAQEDRRSAAWTLRRAMDQLLQGD